MELIVFILLLISSLTIISTQAQDIRMPPSIKEGPAPHIIYRPSRDVDLPCVSDGYPKIMYEWKKNNAALNINQDHITLINGNLRFSPIGAIDEGYYQCIASNQYGATFSNVSFLQMSVLDGFPNSAETLYPVNPGSTLKLICNAPKSIPRARCSWSTANSASDEMPTPVTTDKRVQVDTQGNLVFGYVTSTDEQGGRLYKCEVFNNVLDFTAGGSYSKIIVNSGTVSSSPPVLLSSTAASVTGLERVDLKLRCIFGGNPSPDVKWTRSGSGLQGPRYTYDNYNTMLTISQLEQADAGDYVCSAATSQGSASHTISVTVEASPRFDTSDSGPHNINATVGNTVTVNCKAYAIPAASVTWYKDGVELKPAALPPKFSMNADRTQLTIADVCRDCGNGATDLMALQCNVSNVYGYSMANGYMNVLVPTKMTLDPITVELVPKEEVIFPCAATSDDSTPVTYDWYTNNNLIYNTSSMFIDGSNALHIVTKNDSDSGIARAGTYSCVATNGFSEARADNMLVLPPELLPVTAAIQFWWIGLLLAVIILLLIIIICCCCCIKRNRGETYMVDEKERMNGNNPEKELERSGFQDYQRMDTGYNPGFSQGSLNSSLVKPGSDDSLSEYADYDTGKFNEDGSFNGMYRNDTRHQPRWGSEV